MAAVCWPLGRGEPAADRRELLFSYGFFQFDEYYQITEFVSYKLGKTPPGELAWEFHQQIRPWTQPAIYYAAARGAMAVGIENPFTLSLFFRAISGLCGWAAIVSMMLTARVLFADRGVRRMAVIALALLWLIPYLAVRTSSESLSGDFFAIGFALLLLGSSAAGWSRRRGDLSGSASQASPINRAVSGGRISRGSASDLRLTFAIRSRSPLQESCLGSPLSAARIDGGASWPLP